MSNVKIDQQLVETQVGLQQHTAITFEQLVRYFSPIKFALHNKVSLPMEDSNETLIS